MKRINLPIGIFDSGLGGLTVLKTLQKALPNESFIYIGDTAHLPYGNKSKDSIISYSQHIGKYLISQNVKLIIIACNTASSVALSSLKRNFEIPIIDVITPIEDIIMRDSKIKKIGVIGTHNTIQSHAYSKVLRRKNQNLQIFEQACPLFVPIIEEGLQGDTIAHLAVKKYLKTLINQHIDLLILGCTHYPLIENTIKANIPQKIQILDSAKTMAQYLKKYLTYHQLLCSKTSHHNRIIITDQTEKFQKFALKILNKKNLNIEVLNIT